MVVRWVRSAAHIAVTSSCHHSPPGDCAKNRIASGGRLVETDADAFSAFRHSSTGEVTGTTAAASTHAGSAAADDVAEQLENLVFDGFIAATPLQALRQLPRYLQAAQQRLEALPAGADRDAQGLRTIDRVIEHWNARLAKVPDARRDAVNDAAQWLVEELRVGLFAQRLGTAYPVSEKRIIKAIDALR